MAEVTAQQSRNPILGVPMLLQQALRTIGQAGSGRFLSVILFIGVLTAAVALPADTVSLSAGGDHSCSITGSTAFCWGAGGSGQVGDGTTSGSRRTPVAVSGGTAFAMVSAGRLHSCAVGGTGLRPVGDTINTVRSATPPRRSGQARSPLSGA